MNAAVVGTMQLARIADVDRFYDEFFLMGRPVVVVGAARAIGAFSRWTDAYFQTVAAGLRPMVRFGDGRVGRIPIESFLAYLADPDRFTSSHGSMYLTDFYVRPGFGDARRDALAADATFPLRRGGPYAEWLSVYAGPAGTSTGFHQDIFSTHTWLAQLRGEKIWRLCAPDVDVSCPEALAAGDIYETFLAAGDLIYLPPDWWHEVRNRTSTLAISGNFCSFTHAEAALSEAQSSDSPLKGVWIQTLQEILGQRTEGVV